MGWYVTVVGCVHKEHYENKKSHMYLLLIPMYVFGVVGHLPTHVDIPYQREV